jgi:hypothetical protein
VAATSRRRLRAGTVNVNEAYAAAWASVDAPMGGVGDSGLGRRHGRDGIWKYTEVQTIASQRLLPVGVLPGLSDERTAQVLTVGSGSSAGSRGRGCPVADRPHVPAPSRRQAPPMATVLFTGFPGFLGSELLPRVLRRDDDLEAVCLVQGRFLPLAESRVGGAGRCRPLARRAHPLVEGDITAARPRAR